MKKQSSIEKGAPLNLIYGGVKYSYATNLMGDVVRLYTESGSVAAEYVYDAWGKVISSSGTMAGTNPLRYRGYYFDTETGLYYLNSRYYDPETGRFLNADGTTNTGNGFLGLNMFAYCLNNPVQLKDSDGNRPAAISDHPKDKEAAYIEWMVTKPSNGKVTYAPSGGTAPNRGMSSVSFIGREISSVSYTNIKYYTPEQTHEYVNAILKARTQLDVHGGVMAGLGLAGMTKVGAKLFGGPIIGGVLAVIGELEWVSAQYDNAQLQLLMEIDAAGTGMVTWDLSIDGPTGSSGYNYWDSSKSSVDYGTYPYIKTSTY